MKPTTAIPSLHVTGSIASLFDTILPTERPTITSDPPECTTRSFESFFDVHKPTGELDSAFLSFGSELNKGCESTFIDVMGRSACTNPPRSKVCSFSDYVPSTLLSEYWSFGGVASSWWAEHSSQAVENAAYCPNRWYRAMKAVPYGEVWLNDTLAIVGCYVVAHATSTSTDNKAPTATSGIGVSQTGVKATITAENANGGSRGQNVELWAVTAAGFAVAAVNWLQS
ncbi:hypothetical protein MRS44_016254 [Fusarium solani]|uniref:uncharacterized protein n=1 Tax=Fusarium solani TaxID=169388 RepID=UPI00232231D7|nr:hypothetical protein MRS44_016254 [Fusarium solani]KAJ4214326.1 hypothetical protein NW759_010343 [Fusarium solani]